MELHEYAGYDAIGLRDLMLAGEITAAEVEAVAREALEAADAELNGLALPLFSPALDHVADGPLAGVPFLIKDSGPMAEGVPFAIGSRSLQGITARHDSDLMTRFRAAGLATLGLTTVPEMAISFATESVKHGPTRNPWDTERGVGGIQRRRRRAGRGRRRSDRPRQRRRRLDPRPRRLLRARRAQAEPRSDPVRA